ncbi:MAG: nicotinamidase [Spirochaetaceae bacterium]|jgi:nicotinamidase/pyrazinamidase|nr:nicotinamidase [Spirochaetaceae bacterium]
MAIDFSQSALLIIDVQNDFCPAYTAKDGTKHPAGALAVSRGDRVIEPLNRLAAQFAEKKGEIIATQDWHPLRHISFAASHPGKQINEGITLPVSQDALSRYQRQFPGQEYPVPGEITQLLWPFHCVRVSAGARFHVGLKQELFTQVLRKGFREDLDSYSAFFENDRCTPTELQGYLSARSIKTILVGGLATDYCVFYSVMDGLRLGYRLMVVEDAVAGVDFPPGSVERSVKDMKEGGAVFIASRDIA